MIGVPENGCRDRAIGLRTPAGRFAGWLRLLRAHPGRQRDYRLRRAELMAIDPMRARQAFLDAVALGESGGAYDVLFGGGRFADFSHFPEWEGKEFGGAITHAAGRYQFEPRTWRELAYRLGLADFAPDSQDRAAWDLASRVYHLKTDRGLADDLMAGDASHIAGALHATWTSLSPNTFPERYRRALAALAGASAPLAIGRPLRDGLMGEDVRELQQALLVKGYRVDVDGTFGPRTERAVMDYQRDHRMKVDGIAGALTIAALNA